MKIVKEEVYGKPHQIKINPLTDGGFCVISRQIVIHPRNKELIEYTIDELDNKLFGIKEYIEKKYPIYSYIINSEYQRSSLIDLLVDNIINEKCDIKRNKVNKNS